MEDFIGFYDEGWKVSIDTPASEVIHAKFQHGRFFLEVNLYDDAELMQANLCSRRFARAIRNCFQMNADWDTPAPGWGRVASAVRKVFWRWADRDLVKTVRVLTCSTLSIEGYNMVAKHKFTSFPELLVRFHGSSVFPTGLTYKQQEDWKFLSTRLKQINASSFASIVTKIPVHVKAKDLWGKIPKDSWRLVTKYGAGCLMRNYREVAALRESRSKLQRDRQLAFLRGDDRLKNKARRRILLDRKSVV